MSSILRSTTFLLALILPLTLSSPIPTPLTPLTPRTPVSAAAFADWDTNVVMLGGGQSYGMWIPVDGTWYDLSTVQCLDLPAYAIGLCSSPTIDQIGVAAGNGPCSFVGSDGYSATLSGAAGQGYATVGPPQTIAWAACG